MGGWRDFEVLVVGEVRLLERATALSKKKPPFPTGRGVRGMGLQEKLTLLRNYPNITHHHRSYPGAAGL